MSVARLALLSLCLVHPQQSLAQNQSQEAVISDRIVFRHDRRLRTYRVVTPQPRGHINGIVLMLHGRGGSGSQLLGLNGRKAPFKSWLPIAQREKLILVVPDGIFSPDGHRGWNDARNIDTHPQSDDVGFLQSLTASIQSKHQAHLSPTYVTGISNGGHMALRLAAEQSERYDAVAVVAAANPDPMFGTNPTSPISVMLINGTRDRYMPFAGGDMIETRGRVQSTLNTIEYWRNHNGCLAQPTIDAFDNVAAMDGCKAKRIVYRNPRNRNAVALIQVDNGGHAEPSVAEPYSVPFRLIIGRQNNDFEMADEVWSFFQSVAPAKIPE